MWKPKEIIVNKKVKDDPATIRFLDKCQSVPVVYVDNGKSTTIVKIRPVPLKNKRNIRGLMKYL